MAMRRRTIGGWGGLDRKMESERSVGSGWQGGRVAGVSGWGECSRGGSCGISADVPVIMSFFFE